MAILKVIEWPAKVLMTKSFEVTNFDEDLRIFVSNMHETMQNSRGIGLAANQVNVTKRVVTIKIPWSHQDEQEGIVRSAWHDRSFTFINPKIVKKAGVISWQEGCLSFPDLYEFIDRSEQIWVQAVDEFGAPFEVHADGLFSVCLQHEIDHIDGVVFLERMSRLKAALAKKKLAKRLQMRVNPQESI